MQKRAERNHCREDRAKRDTHKRWRSRFEQRANLRGEGISAILLINTNGTLPSRQFPVHGLLLPLRCIHFSLLVLSTHFPFFWRNCSRYSACKIKVKNEFVGMGEKGTDKKKGGGNQWGRNGTHQRVYGAWHGHGHGEWRVTCVVLNHGQKCEMKNKKWMPTQKVLFTINREIENERT